MLWKRRAATGKQDHRAAVGRVLRPGVVLLVPAGAGNDGKSVVAGGGSGMRGTRKGGQQGRGRGPRKGEYDAWRLIQQEVERRRRQSGGQGRSSAPAEGGAEQSMCPRKKKRGEGSGGPVWKFHEFQGPLGKERFSTDVEV
jgi:hypothetical protein